MTFDIETLQKQIPFYLTAEPDQKVLINELRAIVNGATDNYYISKSIDPYRDEMLQGDGWRAFQVFSFKSGERSSVRGMVLSNSCDISENNDHALPSKIVFAPLIKLSAIEDRLNQRGFTIQQVTDKIAAMKAQQITSIFYLPAGGPLEVEYVTLLDDLHSMPVTAHIEAGEREKLFSLKMAGFWLFVFKLSVHFCRLHEDVNRNPASAGA